MIEGHVQYNGGVWRFYPVYQPTLKCEFDDHRSCKTRSDDYNAMLTENDKKALEEAKAAALADAKDAAAQSEIDSQMSRVNEAGRRRHEATRQNGLIKQGKLDASSKKYSYEVAKAKNAYDLALADAEAICNNETIQTVKDHVDAQNIINATDYVAQVRAEEIASAKAEQDAPANG